MTDFAQEPLWEEEAKEPIQPPVADRDPQVDHLRDAGNAAAADLLRDAPAAPPRVATPEVTEMTVPAPVIAVPAAPDADRSSAQPQPDPPSPDWRPLLRALLADFDATGVDRHLPPLVAVAATIPRVELPMIASALVSAFLALPAGQRKPVRDRLLAQLAPYAQLDLVRLILTRLGGVPAADPPAPPPPPPPPADP